MVTHDKTFDISGYHTQIMFTNSMHTKLTYVKRQEGVTEIN